MDLVGRGAPTPGRLLVKDLVRYYRLRCDIIAQVKLDFFDVAAVTIGRRVGRQVVVMTIALIIAAFTTGTIAPS